MGKPDHERLLVYQKALDVAVHLEHLAQAIAPARGDLREQLRRASVSVPLNIAEGAGEFSRAENRFYRLARRSAAECLAILDLVERIYGTHAPDARSGLMEVGAMLTALARKSDQ